MKKWNEGMEKRWDASESEVQGIMEKFIPSYYLFPAICCMILFFVSQAAVARKDSGWLAGKEWMKQNYQPNQYQMMNEIMKICYIAFL